MRRIQLPLFAAALIAALPVQAAQTDAPQPQTASRINVTTVATGLANPWGLQFLPDGRMLVTERPGRLRIVTREGKIGPVIAGKSGC